MSLIHFDTPDIYKFKLTKTDEGNRRTFFALADPLVLIRCDFPDGLGESNYYDASIGWDDGTEGYVMPENVGLRHTKITLRTDYGRTPPPQFDITQFVPLSQVLAKAPRRGTRKFDAAKIAEEVIGQVRSHVFRFGLRVYIGGVLPQAHDTEWCDLKAEIETLCKVANGEVSRIDASEEFVDEIVQLVQDIAELTCPWWTTQYMIPNDWRETDLGQAWDYARYWLVSNDLIPLADAARLLYDGAGTAELGKLERRIKRGDLAEYKNPLENNPQRGRCVLKGEVKKLLRRRGD